MFNLKGFKRSTVLATYMYIYDAILYKYVSSTVYLSFIDWMQQLNSQKKLINYFQGNTFSYLEQTGLLLLGKHCLHCRLLVDM